MNILSFFLLSLSQEIENDSIGPANIPSSVLSAQYAVRGELVQKAGELKKRLINGESFAFDEVVFCNIGNPQSVGNPSISFIRQVFVFVFVFVFVLGVVCLVPSFFLSFFLFFSFPFFLWFTKSFHFKRFVPWSITLR